MDFVADVPLEVPLIAGELIQNLRSALDHLAYELYSRGRPSGGSGRHIYFPIADDQTSYNDKKSRQTRGMTSQAISAIDSVKPYKGGNDILWQLHELNNIDKHRLILTVGSAVRSLDLAGYMQQSVPSGSIMSQIKWPSVFFKPADNEYPLKVGTVVFSDLTTTEVKNPTMRFEVVLYEKDVIEGKSLHEALQEMVSAVENVITDFQPLLV